MHYNKLSWTHRYWSFIIDKGSSNNLSDYLKSYLLDRQTIPNPISKLHAKAPFFINGIVYLLLIVFCCEHLQIALLEFWHEYQIFKFLIVSSSKGLSLCFICSDQHVKYRMPCGFLLTTSLLLDYHIKQ